jgi:hypothetical protein
MNDPDERLLTPSALLRTMAVAALLASAVSACNKSLDKPALPQPPKPHTTVSGPGHLTHAIYSTQPGVAAFYRDGGQPRATRLVIRT